MSLNTKKTVRFTGLVNAAIFMAIAGLVFFAIGVPAADYINQHFAEHALVSKLALIVALAFLVAMASEVVEKIGLKCLIYLLNRSSRASVTKVEESKNEQIK
jgi:uncharacterized membrane protein YcjF (UPF0283 family)